MFAKTQRTTVKLPEVVCGNCNLRTRADWPKCLHCERPLRLQPKEVIRTSAPAQSAGNAFAA